ncbi:hypothetical protein [Pseudomonas sp. PICF141]
MSTSPVTLMVYCFIPLSTRLLAGRLHTPSARPLPAGPSTQHR